MNEKVNFTFQVDIFITINFSDLFKKEFWSRDFNLTLMNSKFILKRMRDLSYNKSFFSQIKTVKTKFKKPLQ
jgi:hypothetical protein